MTPNTLQNLIRIANKALKGDSNDAEHDALLELRDRLAYHHSRALVSQPLTPTQRKAAKYLRSHGACCPHCGGEIRCMPGKALYDSDAVVQRVECQNCSEEWNDVYKLAAVTTVDGELIASISIPEEKQL